MKTIQGSYKGRPMTRVPLSSRTILHTFDSELGGLLRHANHLLRVRETIIRQLPGAAAQHVFVADLNPQKLIIHTDSTGWATRLRYATPAIRRALAQELRLHTEQIKVRVRPGLADRQQPPVQRHISAANRNHIRSIAGYINDPQLAASLQALAAVQDNGDTRG